MEQEFKQAVCDAFHGDSDEDILESGLLVILQQLMNMPMTLVKCLLKPTMGCLKYMTLCMHGQRVTKLNFLGKKKKSEDV